MNKLTLTVHKVLRTNNKDIKVTCSCGNRGRYFRVNGYERHDGTKKLYGKCRGCNAAHQKLAARKRYATTEGRKKILDYGKAYRIRKKEG